jgi:DNA-binding beta-propeller fold protein YncE
MERTMRESSFLIAAGIFIVASLAPAASAQSPIIDGNETLVVLPSEYNTTDSMAMLPDGSIVLAVPNYNNLTLRKYGTHLRESPARLAILDPKRRTIRDWYVFQPNDLNPVTGKAAPMGVALGPDGNLYFVDRQMPFTKLLQSRIGRVVIKNGKPDHVEYVVDGSFAANDLVWHKDRLYVTDSVLVQPKSKTENIISAVYSFTLDELNGEPVHLVPYASNIPDRHIMTTFVSNNKIGAGADGIAFDDKDNLYVGVIEEGTIYRIATHVDGSHDAPIVFARDAQLLSTDGLSFDRERRQLYVADFLGNAIHAVSLDGKVTTLLRSGDGDSSRGDLDQPCAILQMGDDLLVSNMDYAGAAPGFSVNSRVHDVHAITSLRLHKR